jgi:hypothetical protein
MVREVGAGRGISKWRASSQDQTLLPARLTDRPHEAVDTEQQNHAALLFCAWVGSIAGRKKAFCWLKSYDYCELFQLEVLGVARPLCASSSPDFPLYHPSVCILMTTIASWLSQDFKSAPGLGVVYYIHRSIIMPNFSITTARYARAVLALRDLHHPYFSALSSPPVSRPTELSAALKP